MAESTLAVTLNEIRSEVCRYLGFGRFYNAASPVQRDDCDLIIRRGLRQFYCPPPLPQESSSHRWSFLEPSATLATVANTASYVLPDDFGGMAGEFSFSGETTSSAISSVGEAAFRAAQSSSDATMRPQLAYVDPRQTVSSGNPDIPTRWQVTFHPVPDKVYTLVYRYYVVQDAAAAALDYVPGGALHGETILASCLAIAETYAESPNAKFREYFMQRLIASVLLDRKTAGAGMIGRNLDRSDSISSPGQKVLVTYNNILY
jgi:hypothetical protein